MDDPHVVRLSRLFDENGLATGPVRKTVLVVVDGSSAGRELDDAKRYFADEGPAVEFATVADVGKKETQTSEYDVIVSGVIGNGVPCDLDLFSAYTKLLRAKGGGGGAALIVKTDEASDASEKTIVKRLKMCGFVNVAPGATSGTVVGYTPAYEVGSSDKVALHSETKDNVISAWKSDDYNGETISEDDLLEADDLIRPVSSSLRVCATTKKAKACKDCSCGLAEELEANRVQDGPKPPAPDTSNAKSSCGSCYLGDAFRCASCPYLGMPAFKPGEKVQLAGNLLQDDF